MSLFELVASPLSTIICCVISYVAGPKRDAGADGIAAGLIPEGFPHIWQDRPARVDLSTPLRPVIPNNGIVFLAKNI